MVFSLREAIGGLKHLGLGWTRMLAKRSDTYFIADYERRGILAQRFLTRDGQLAICPICHYAMIRLELPNGWLFETCSAMPAVNALGSKEFAQWAESLSPAKLPTARV